MNHDAPDFRAVINRGRLTLVPWNPCMLRPGGPGSRWFRERGRSGVVLADLRVLRHEDEPWELIVEVLGARELPDEASQAILEWAGPLGYGRVWLPGEVVAPDADVDLVHARARARCPSCRARWENDELDFWETVRAWGHFPLACPLCGADRRSGAWPRAD